MSPSWRYIRKATPSAYATGMPMKMRVRLVNGAPRSTGTSTDPPGGCRAGLGAPRRSARPRLLQGPRSRSRRWQILGQRVAAAAQGADRVVQGRDRLHLGTQGLDVGVDGAVHAVAVIAPDAIEQRLARKDVARARGECLEQAEFIARELQRAAVVAHLHAPFVDDDRSGPGSADACDCRRCARLGGAPQDAAHARDELARRERLGDVVVGAELEADDAIDLVAARGEKEDRHVAR